MGSHQIKRKKNQSNKNELIVRQQKYEKKVPSTIWWFSYTLWRYRENQCCGM